MGTVRTFMQVWVVLCLAASAAIAAGGGVTSASAQTLTEGWGGIPPGGTLDQLQYYNTPAEACKSLEGAYIPYFGYSVNTLISISPSADIYSTSSGKVYPAKACLFTANGYPNSTVYIEFGCTSDHTSSNGVCLPLGYPQNACPTCDGNVGTPGLFPVVNHPVSTSDGAKTEIVTDYTSGGAYPIEITRRYRSLFMPTSGDGDGLGVAWRTGLVRAIEIFAPGYNVIVRREDGSRTRFINSNSASAWPAYTIETQFDSTSGQFFAYPETDANDRLAEVTPGQVYEYTDEHDRVDRFEGGGSTFRVTQTRWRGGYQRTYSYDANGNLVEIDDNLGRSVLLTWQGGVITNIALPGGNSIQYSYQQQIVNGVSIPGTEVLTQATRYNANGTVADTVSYQYDRTKTVPLLTGIIDAKGVLFETTSYDQFGRVTATQRAGGADAMTIVYGDNVAPGGWGTRTVTNALGQVEVYHVIRNYLAGEPIGGVFILREIDRQASANVPAATMQTDVDGNGFLSDWFDWNGIHTWHINDTQGRETSRLEDANTLARQINTTWHPTFRLPTQIVLGQDVGVNTNGTFVPTRTWDFTYDANGRLTQRKVTDNTPHSGSPTRVWNYTWTTTGLLASVDGPRTDVSDVTTYTYDAHGNLATVTNALNQTTTVTAVDARGLPLSVTDPNGVATNLAYDGIGRLISSTVQGPTPATTTFTYDLNGLLVGAQAPNGVTLTYTYDAAHRLTGVMDSQGNQMVFTLDALGNRVQTQVVSGSAQVLKTSSATFDTLGRLMSAIGAYGQTTSFGYDNEANLTSIIDPRNAPTTQAFDGLYRVKQITDALNGTAQLVYDIADNLTSLTDANSGVTTYTYNGFGDVTQMVSPDTGTTTFTLDSAGNIISKTDARKVVTNYTYDALNRLTSRTFPRSTGENVTFTYDQTANGNKGVGRLTAATDAAGSASLVYDSYGNLITQTRVISGVSYVTSFIYDLAGNLTGITYPSGLIVGYQRDSLGHVATVTMNAGAGTVTLASNIQYLPFGPAQSLTLGNGMPVSYAYDQDYRLTRILTGSPAVQDLSFTYDLAGNIAGISDAVNSNRSQTLQYDLLGRVVQGTGYYGNDNYTYDAVGNRLTRTLVTTGTASTTYAYAANSNRLTGVTSGGSTRAYSYDANGNVTAVKIGTKTQAAYTFNNNNRLATATSSTYTYDAFGARVIEAVTGGATTHFLFGPKGQLLAEATAQGQVQRSYVYLNGVPLALVDSIGSVSYVLNDQLGQPQKMLSGSGALNWDRIAGIFGDTVAQPVGSATTNPLRFPGQQYDAATGLHYNYFRDYDPSLGRYIESDAIGLAGGVNTYAYVGSNPLSHADRFGLDVTVYTYPGQGGNPFGHVGISVNGNAPVGYDPASGYGVFGSVPGKVDSIDPSRSAEDSNTIRTTPDQDKRMQDYIDKITKDPGQYDASGNNCARFAEHTLAAGGINSSDTMWPRDLSQSLKQIRDP